MIGASPNPARPSLLVMLAATCLGGTSVAQAQTPENWRVVQEPAALAGGKVEFVKMPPGWHITTGPASLLFDGRRFLEGPFAVSAELFLFPESSQDGYGIFVGGDALDGAGARYVALQLRRDGSASVMQRRGNATSLLVDWKPIAAVGAHPGKDTHRILMSVELDSATVAFKANGAEVARIPRTGLDLSGRFGFRLGSGINLHVVSLDVAEKLAPPKGR